MTLPDVPATAAGWTLAQLEGLWPSIPWRQPLPIRHAETNTEHFACRVCIARVGLKGSHVALLPTDRAIVAAHIREHMP